MARKLIYEIRMSDAMQTYLAASLDLLQAVLETDEVLVADEIREAADELLAIIEGNRGKL